MYLVKGRIGHSGGVVGSVDKWGKVAGSEKKGGLAVYALADETGKFWYLGITANLLRRIRAHRVGTTHTNKEYRDIWEKLRGKFSVVLLEWTSERSREAVWVKKLLDQGHPLINVYLTSRYRKRDFAPHLSFRKRSRLAG